MPPQPPFAEIMRLARCLGCAALLLLLPPLVRSEEEPVTVPKTKENLHFELPPDWPVEKRGGLVAPIPIEEYLAKRFKMIDSRSAAMEQRVKTLEQRVTGLELRVRKMEERVKKPVPAQEPDAPAGAPR